MSEDQTFRAAAYIVNYHKALAGEGTIQTNDLVGKELWTNIAGNSVELMSLSPAGMQAEQLYLKLKENNVLVTKEELQALGASVPTIQRG